MKKKILLGILIVFSIIFVSCSSDIDTTATSEVTGMVAKSGNSSVELTWSNPSDIDFDHVEIIATPNDTTLETITVETNDDASTYTVTGLTNYKEYTFVIKAIDTSGNKCAGCNSVTATPADTIATSEVTNLTATVVNTGTVISLTWNNPTDIDFDHVEITATPTDITEATVTVETLDKDTETYTFSGLTNDKEYTFIVRTIDTSGNKSEGSIGVKATPIDSIAPSEVTNLTATEESTGTVISLTWSNPSDIDFDHVEIIATPTDTSLLTITTDETIDTETYTVTGLKQGTEYTFIVRTIDTSNNKSDGCDGVLLRTYGTSSGINSPSWIEGLWGGNLICTGSPDTTAYCFEFSNDDFKETVNGITISYKGMLASNVYVQWMPDVTSISSTTSPTTFNININYSDGSIDDLYFTKDSSTSLTILFGSTSGTLEFGKELVYEIDSSISITPPEWILGTWSGISTDLLDISIEFTSDNILETYQEAMTINLENSAFLESFIIGVSSSYTDKTFTVIMTASDDSTFYYTYTKNADGTLTAIMEGHNVILSKD